MYNLFNNNPADRNDPQVTQMRNEVTSNSLLHKTTELQPKYYFFLNFAIPGTVLVTFQQNTMLDFKKNAHYVSTEIPSPPKYVHN